MLKQNRGHEASGVVKGSSSNGMCEVGYVQHAYPVQQYVRRVQIAVAKDFQRLPVHSPGWAASGGEALKRVAELEQFAQFLLLGLEGVHETVTVAASLFFRAESI